MIEEVRLQINALAEEKYKKFASGLIPGKDNILGVRLPMLRSLAKEIAKGDWRASFSEEDEFFEEVMVRGMVIGNIKEDIEAVLYEVEKFIPLIDNWSVCDSFCAGLKITNKNKERVWDFIMPYFSSEKEFEVRFAVVMVIFFFIQEKYISDILEIFNNIKQDGKYVKLAVAWAVSVCYIKLPTATLKFLKNNALDDFTHNKSLQKICESYRVDDDDKIMIRTLKRR